MDDLDADSSCRDGRKLAHRRLNNAFNFIASQVLWVAAVGGAAHGMAWLGPAVWVVFAAIQLWPGLRVPGDFKLMRWALLTGLLLDSTMAATGLARYASPVPFTWMAPVWILALWMGFALTFNHSAAGLMRRPRLAAAFGAVMGPFSYWIAARVWHAVAFATPAWQAMLTLALLWSSAMWLLARASCRLAAGRSPTAQSSET